MRVICSFAAALRGAWPGLLVLLLALPGLALWPTAAQAQTPTVTVTPAGPLTLCAGTTQTLTAAATVAAFNAGGSGTNTTVWALAVQPDGKVLVGGQFNAYNGAAAAPDRVLRLNADGSLDNTFNAGGSGVNGIVYALALQPDGKMLVGGRFSTYNGAVAAPDRMLRLNADGSLDNTFNAGGSGASDAVYALALQPDGKVLVGGEFNFYNGAAAPGYVLRLNAAGSLDNTFNAGGNGASDIVRALALQPDGKVLIGGQFGAYNGAATPAGVLRLNAAGSLDNTFNVGGSGASDVVYALAVQPDGKVLVGGDFTFYNGAAAPAQVLRLNAAGSLDDGSLAGLAYTWSNGATGPSITVSQPGDYQATATTTANGTGYSNVVRLNAPPAVTVSLTPAGPLALTGGASQTLTAAATVAAFNAGGSGASNGVYALAVQPDGKVLVGGNFTTYNGAAAAPDRVLRLNADGTLDNTFNAGGSGADGNVYALALQPDGKVLVGGNFSAYNGAAAPAGVLRLNADGSLDNTFNAGGSGADASVQALALLPDGKVLFGGLFNGYNGAAAPGRVLRLNADGSLDNTFNTGGSGADGIVQALALQPDGKVLVGGDFINYNGAAAPDRVLRLNADGSLDNTFNAGGSGASSIVYALALQPDGKVLVGGGFPNYNGNAAAPDGVLRLNADGSLDNTFNMGGSGANNFVRALALQPDGKVLVGGGFTTYNGAAAPPDRVLRLNADGSLDNTFNAGGSGVSGTVYALAVQPDGRVLVGGFFTAYNGNTAAPDYVLRLNADGSLNDAATALPGATFVFDPGNTTGNTRSVSTAGTYTATATDPATGCSYLSNAVEVTVAAPADLTISTGTLAAPVAVAAGTYNSITVTGTGYATLAGAVVVNSAVSVSGSLDTSCQPLTGGASFTLAAGATLYICDAAGISANGANTGAVQLTGTRSFSDDAIYRYSGPVAQVTGSGLPATVRELCLNNAAGATLSQAVSIRQRVQLSSGDLSLDGQSLTLLSTASGTALIDNTGGLVLGNTGTLQRHIETNAASGGYRHYASPMVANAGAETLATLATAGYTPNFSGAAAYNTSATPGLVTPFPTVFGYNQDRIASTVSNYDTFGKGWQAALGTEVPQVGRGYSVQISGAALVDFTGTFTSGSVSRSNLQRASADPATGWHLLGNPFPSPLDWSTMTLGAGQNLENMDGAVYVFQSSGPYTGQYRTYLANLPGGSSPIIPAGSGFFVHTTSPATAGTVRFTGANRVTEFDAQPAFGRSSSTRPVLTLTLAGPATDAVTLYLDPAATAGVDAAYDATKLPNPSGLNLAVLAGSTPLAIAGLPTPTATTVLALALAVPTAGSYTLRVDELTNFTALPVYLRDAQAGTEQLLTPGYTVSLTLAAGSTTRFSLVLRPAGALATAGSALVAQASVYPNPAHAAFTLTLPPVLGAAQATATLRNALGQVVSTRVLPLTAGGATASYTTAGLAAGVYALRLQAGAETATLRVVVE